MASDAEIERLAVQEMSSFFPTGRLAQFEEGEIQKIGQLLSQATSKWRSDWSAAPRLYCVLRLIDKESAMDEFIANGVTTDFWFPFDSRSLPNVLDEKDADRFLGIQHIVETGALFLEKDAKTGRRADHQTFANDSVVPLILRRQLGKGTFGEVHEVQSKTSLRVYARKQMQRSKGFIKTKQAQSQFEREREILMKIKHQHCIEFIGSYSTLKYLSILVSPVADMNLKDFLAMAHKSHPSYNPTLRTFFGCLARGFQYLHIVRKIRHRDIKPENILIHNGRVKISDFGLSLTWADGHSTTTWKSCPGFSRQYCAPEVANAQGRNSSSDIWSLGCVFLEMVTVLKGKSTVHLQDFITDYEDDTTDKHADEVVYYYTKPNAIRNWTRELARTSQDNEPIAWVNTMMAWNSKLRPNAARVVELTGYDDNHGLEWPFCGMCCAEDSDDEDDAEVTLTPPSADETDALELRPGKKEAANSSMPQLQQIARQGDDKLLRTVLQAGADLEAIDANGWSALRAASYYGRVNIVEILIEKGARVNAKDDEGRTALYQAATAGHADVAALLLRRGADIEARTNEGRTALYGAAFNGKAEVAKLLLDSGADIESKTVNGRTPLHAAALHGSEATARLLIARGANVSAGDHRGMTAVHCGALHGLDMVQLLTQRSTST